MSKLQFRVLYREFLFRLVDREVLAVHAQGDASKLLGQFATVLIVISFGFVITAFAVGDAHSAHQTVLVAEWAIEHLLIATTMLIVGLFAVLSWDSAFPDRRDVLVLAPLPVRPSTIFLAKAVSVAVALSLTVITFNAAPGLTLPMVLAPPSTSLFDMIFSLGIYRALLAYWITMLAAGVFIFCCTLIVQGVAAQLPRRISLRLSAFLQMTAFCTFVGVYFLQPPLAFPQALTDGRNQQLLCWLPSYWFLGLFQQLNGSLNGPARAILVSLATRAWIALGLGVTGAGAAFLLSYLRTLRKIAEEPDIVAGSGRLSWLPRFGTYLETAIVHFSIRTLVRSRQHRVIFSFYAGMGFAFLVLILKTPVAQKLSAASSNDNWWHQVRLPLLASSFIMLCFWTLGIRAVFAMPLELRANWIFRITEIRGPAGYLRASRRAMWALALLPVWGASALIFLSLWPRRPAMQHLLVLGLVGIIAIELCLGSFRKIPFTCSYLPGKSNLHITVLLCLMLVLNALFWCAEFERRALADPVKYGCVIAILCVAAACAWWRAQTEGDSENAVLRFEEEQLPVIGSLGLHRDGLLPVSLGDQPC